MFGCAKLTFMIPAGPQEIQSISFAVSKWGLFKKLIFFCSIFDSATVVARGHVFGLFVCLFS